MFKCALGLASLGDVGMAVFPNVDSQCFKGLKGFHVEIDMVLIHPQKGAFLFNVKNAEKVSPRSIADDVLRHASFLRQLCRGSEEMPVNAIVCSMKKTLDGKFRKTVTDQLTDFAGKVFFFQPPDVKDFSRNWKERVLSEVDDLKGDEAQLVDVLALRLFAINVMTGSLSFLHKKFTDEGFQTMTKSEKDYAKINAELAKAGVEEVGGDQVEVPLLADDLNRLNIAKASSPSSAVNPNKRVVILWTKQQLGLIHGIMRRLRSRESGCRILVKGCKGSGKTMIMAHIAQLAKHALGIEKIVVADGRLGSSLVFLDDMKKCFQDSGITVAGVKLKELKHEAKGCSLLLFDECNNSRVKVEQLEQFASKKTHLILFTSGSMEVGAQYKIFSLDAALRMTVEIANICEKLRSLFPDHREIALKPRHNVVGATPTVEVLDASGDLTHEPFVKAALRSLKETLFKCGGLQSVLLAPFIHAITLTLIATAFHFA